MKQFVFRLMILLISIVLTAGCAEAGTEKQAAAEPSGSRFSPQSILFIIN